MEIILAESQNYKTKKQNSDIFCTTFTEHANILRAGFYKV